MSHPSIRPGARVALAGVVLVLGSSIASAQTNDWTDRGFINANVGVQARPDTFTQTSTPLIYGEPASIVAPISFGRSPLFDVSAGLRVWENLGVSAGYSRLSKSATTTLTATVPNPVIVGAPRTASTDITDLAHTESDLHLSLLWMIPFSPKFDVAGILGASIINVSQDLVTGVKPAEGTPPFTSVSIASAQTTSASKTAPALTLGADATYRVTRQFGAGVFVRFSRLNGGHINIDDPSGGPAISVAAGGLQAGVGVRARF